MPENTTQSYDILIAGAGFGGSLTALILDKIGFNVCLVEKGTHPRFAIGESSTPIADMILRKIAVQYDLPWLSAFSRYGSWQDAHPEVICGLKRGFSYFKHHPGQEFYTDTNHTNELLVAASTDDVQSDTNWLRADFDAFLVNKVQQAGIAYFDLTEITSAKRTDEWEFKISQSGRDITIKASFFIDATGGGALLHNLLGVKSSADEFLTNSFGVFSHFNDVPRWTSLLKEAGIPTNDFPYDPDNSALHQVLDEGWIWMLRFNTDLISIGFALNQDEVNFDGMSPDEIWGQLLQKYPSVNKMLKDASIADVPGKILKSNRLQRKTEHSFGDGWIALPHTVGFVDPLFSSGIAHSLAGIEKIANLLHEYWDNKEQLYSNLEQYECSVFEELKLIDKLVAGCYKTMAHFGLFNAWSMLYFAATITYEQRRLKNLPVGYFLGADSQSIRDMVDISYQDLMNILDQPQITQKDIEQFTDLVRERIAPFNTAGLLDPASKNMYRHTNATL